MVLPTPIDTLSQYVPVKKADPMLIITAYVDDVRMAPTDSNAMLDAMRRVVDGNVRSVYGSPYRGVIFMTKDEKPLAFRLFFPRDNLSLISYSKNYRQNFFDYDVRGMVLSINKARPSSGETIYGYSFSIDDPLIAPRWGKI
jgi:hypothetical protein